MPKRNRIKLAVAAVILATALATIAVVTARTSAHRSAEPAHIPAGADACPHCPHITDEHTYEGCNHVSYDPGNTAGRYCRCLTPFGGER